jgi:hypothetical protein
LGEFEGILWIRRDGLAFDSWFSFQNSIWTCRGTRPRGSIVVDPRPWRRSNPFSDTFRRIGTFVPWLLSTNIAIKLPMLHCQRMISITLIKLKIEAQLNRNSSISTYATRFRIIALKSTCSTDEDWPRSKDEVKYSRRNQATNLGSKWWRILKFVTFWPSQKTR